MPSITHKSFRGMNNDVNPLGASEGLVKDALNVVFRRPGMAEPRDGMRGSDPSDHSGVAAVQRMVSYRGKVVLLDDAEVNLSEEDASASEVTFFGGSLGNGYNGYCSAVEMRGNLYMAHEEGPLKITGPTDTAAERAGVSNAYAQISNLFWADETAESISWWQNGYTIGYRAIVRRTDANGVVTRSRPTELVFKQNTDGGLRTPTLDIAVVAEAGDVIEVYRTRSVNGTVPPAQTFLAFEYVYGTASSFYDRCPDDNLGAAMPFDEGPRPAVPYAGKCLASFAGSLFLGNVTSPQYLELAPRDGSGVKDAYTEAVASVTSGSDTITVNTINRQPAGSQLAVGQYIWGDGVTIPGGGVYIDAVSGTGPWTVTMSSNAIGTDPSVALRISEVVELSNGAGGVAGVVLDTIRAQSYIGVQLEAQTTADRRGTDHGDASFDLGAVRFYEPRPGGRLSYPSGTAFAYAIRASNGDTMFTQEFATFEDGSGTPFSQDVEPALLMWSLLDQPEMFTPGVGQAYVGVQSKAIWSLESRGDRLFIFKEDGIFVLEGASERSGFRIDKLDSDHIVMTPRHTCVTEFGVAAWTKAGVILVDDGGAIRNLSAHVVDEWLGRFGDPSDDPDEIGGQLFYNAEDHELHLIAKNGQNANPGDYEYVHLVWNSHTNAWSRWELKWPALAGCSPGYAGRRVAFFTNDTSPRVWHDLRRVNLAFENPEEMGLSDQLAEFFLGSFSYVLAGSDSAYFDYTPTAETLLAAGDGWILNNSARYIVTSVQSLGGGVYRVHLYADPDHQTLTSTGTRNAWVLYAFTSSLRLHAQGGEGDAPKFWESVRWKQAPGSRVYQATVGARSSTYRSDESEVQTNKLDRADSYVPTYDADIDVWHPRYLFGRNHATAEFVEPFIQIREAGAYFGLNGAEIRYERGPEVMARYG